MSRGNKLDYPCPLCGEEVWSLDSDWMENNAPSWIYKCRGGCMEADPMTFGFVAGLLLKLKSVGVDTSIYNRKRKKCQK